jgi:hypothetical protein
MHVSGYHISGYPVLPEKLDENMHVSGYHISGYPVLSEKLDENMRVSGYHISGYPVLPERRDLPEKLDQNMQTAYLFYLQTQSSLLSPVREARQEHANCIAVLSSKFVIQHLSCSTSCLLRLLFTIFTANILHILHIHN